MVKSFICRKCNQIFKKDQTRENHGRAKYCSRKCKYSAFSEQHRKLLECPVCHKRLCALVVTERSKNIQSYLAGNFMEVVMKECLRFLKPGAHGLVWAIPRTSHWTATALEDAGFEVRDVITRTGDKADGRRIHKFKPI